MTGLLTAAAVIATIMLLVSGTNAGSRATASDQHRRGSWGIANWTSDRRRSLNPHERRWQTALLSAKENDTRWKDLVDEISHLERLSATTPVSSPPSSRDSKWLEASIVNLENSLTPTDTGADSS